MKHLLFYWCLASFFSFRFFSWSQGLVSGDCINRWQMYPWNTMRSVTVCAKGILKDKHDLIVLFSFKAHSIDGWFYYGACALSPSVISVVCFGDLPSWRFTVSSKKRRSQTGIICCMTALFGGPVKGWEKGINEGFKIYVLLFPTIFLAIHGFIVGVKNRVRRLTSWRLDPVGCLISAARVHLASGWKHLKSFCVQLLLRTLNQSVLCCINLG